MLYLRVALLSFLGWPRILGGADEFLGYLKVPEMSKEQRMP